MTREDIIRMYEKANGWSPEGWDKTVDELERFANLVAAAEREECAKICGALANGYAKSQDFHALSAAEDCEAAIRYRGQE